MFDNEIKPLVSIIVIVFNSAKYVLDTLESSKRQNYKNIELIITDDCSIDNTVEICRGWINENEKYFVSVKLIEADNNTGIPGNCNRGLYSSSGEWIKFIAGDDLLLPNCVSVHINGVKRFPHEKFFVSGGYVMHGETVNRISMPPKGFLNKEATAQMKYFLKYSSYIFAPATFFEKASLVSVGGFNEDYPGIEDYPLYLKIVKNGYRFQLINLPTVIYRSHQESITRSPSKVFKDSYNRHMEDVVFEMLKENGMFFWLRHFEMNRKLVNEGKNNKHILWKIRLTDPIYWYKKLYKCIFGKKVHIRYKKTEIEPISKNKFFETEFSEKS
jgi:alpha-1,3-rhamnosyltransferase